MNPTANHQAAAKAGIASLFAIEHRCPDLPEEGSLGYVRAERAKIKSPGGAKDDR
jgi:hypothetical protein